MTGYERIDRNNEFLKSIKRDYIAFIRDHDLNEFKNDEDLQECFIDFFPYMDNAKAMKTVLDNLFILEDFAHEADAVFDIGEMFLALDWAGLVHAMMRHTIYDIHDEVLEELGIASFWDDTPEEKALKAKSALNVIAYYVEELALYCEDANAIREWITNKNEELNKQIRGDE